MHCLKNSRRFIDWSFDGFIDSLAANRTWFLFSSISQAKSLRKFVCSSLGTVCNELPLGIQDLSIPNSAISASSFEADSPPSSARIYNPGGWRALSNDTSPYLEVSHYNIVSVKRNEFHFTHIYKKLTYRVFSHDVTVAILVSQNNETAAMSVSQTLSFVPINLHRCWPREWKHSVGMLWRLL